jgi:TIR domain-containing protein
VSGSIFISYRRDDQPGFAGRLYDWLGREFPKNQLFMDVDNIPAGVDFVDYLAEQVNACDVLLALIGPDWRGERQPDGTYRIDRDDDFVRVEIDAALKGGKLVIPVLVGQTRMVSAPELPASLKSLARRNAVRVTHERFRTDFEGLIPRLKAALETMKEKPPPAPPPPPPPPPAEAAPSVAVVVAPALEPPPATVEIEPETVEERPTGQTPAATLPDDAAATEPLAPDQETRRTRWIITGFLLMVLFLVAAVVIFSDKPTAPWPTGAAPSGASLPSTTETPPQGFGQWQMVVRTTVGTETVRECLASTAPYKTDAGDLPVGHWLIVKIEDKGTPATALYSVKVDWSDGDDKLDFQSHGSAVYHLQPDAASADIFPVINLLIAGTDATVSGTTVSGKRQTETYSLAGFTGAYNAAKSACHAL